MTPKDPLLEGTFWDKFWRPIRSWALLFTPETGVGGTAAEKIDVFEAYVPSSLARVGELDLFTKLEPPFGNHCLQTLGTHKFVQRLSI